MPAYWRDTTYDRRLPAVVTNTTGLDLHDHLVAVTLPPGVTPDAASLRVQAVSSAGCIERDWDARYGTGAGIIDANHLVYLPAYLSGGVVTFKALGKWAIGETRRFHLSWQQTPTASAVAFSHLGPRTNTWVATVVAAVNGATYALVMGGQTYSFTAGGADTTSTIATALRALINAGTVATATGSAATINVSRTNLADLTFLVTNTGTTTPTNLTVVKPQVWRIARTGPDTNPFSADYATWGVPWGAQNTGTTGPGRVSFGRGTSQAVRLMTYRVNADATDYGAIDATVGALTDRGPYLDVAGALTFSTRSAGVDWSGAYTATYQHRFYTGRKSDDTGPGTLTKYVDVTRVTLVYTCQRQYAPTTIPAGQTAATTTDVLQFGSQANTFGGNVTEAAGNKIANFTAPASTGVITSYAASADLSALPAAGTIVGAHGNNAGDGILINSIAFAGFTHTPTPHWAAQGNAFARLQLTDLDSLTPIPVGATITVDFTYISGSTTNVTTVGDNLLPDEIVALLRALTATPTVAVGRAESYAAGALPRTLALAGDAVVRGCQWWADHALADTGLAHNTGYQRDMISGAVAQTDDDDDGYGEAHKLHGLCLRYRRTHDAALIAQIERQVQYHLTVEADAIAAYGAWWAGSSPYGYWASPTSSGGLYPTEGGISPNGGDPNFNGGLPGAITYTQGQLRRNTSIDQCHMCAHGLYAYLYLLRNEAAITANTTLRANALAFLSRMATFETAHFGATARTIDNCYAICNGGSPTHNNGIDATRVNIEAGTAITNPYLGDFFAAWMVSNGDGQLADASANSTLDYFFRAAWAGGSTTAGVVNFLTGRVHDFETLDLGRHEVTTTLTTSGVLPATPAHPLGWCGRTGITAQVTKYQAGRAGDDHYLSLGSSGAGSRDQFSPRTAQRAVCVALLALLDPTVTIVVQIEGGVTTRSVAVLALLDDYMRVLAAYAPHTATGAQRWAVPAWLGGTGGQTIDSAMTGYWLMAIELWYLVQARVAGALNPADYYLLAGL